MNAPEILTKFETMVGDSLDQDFELHLANDGYYQVPFERAVEYRVRPPGS
jgi:hypothetical protein